MTGPAVRVYARTGSSMTDKQDSPQATGFGDGAAYLASASGILYRSRQLIPELRARPHQRGDTVSLVEPGEARCASAISKCATASRN